MGQTLAIYQVPKGTTQIVGLFKCENCDNTVTYYKNALCKICSHYSKSEGDAFRTEQIFYAPGLVFEDIPVEAKYEVYKAEWVNKEQWNSLLAVEQELIQVLRSVYRSLKQITDPQARDKKVSLYLRHKIAECDKIAKEQAQALDSRVQRFDYFVPDARDQVIVEHHKAASLLHGILALHTVDHSDCNTEVARKHSPCNVYGYRKYKYPWWY
jgi:hypothetical protein